MNDIDGTAVFNDCGGLMARVADLAAAGDCEDWVQNTIMPAWDVGNKWDNVDAGWRTEMGIVWNGPWNYNNKLRLKRVGNTFSFYMYQTTPYPGWVQLGGSPYIRDDMAGPVQVGIWQGMYATDPGWVTFDDFSLTYTVYEKARTPSPSDEETSVLIGTSLSWVPGDLVQASNGHEVYIGTDETAVTDANRVSHPGVDLYIVSTPSVSPGPFETYTTYYWRVDEVNEPTRWPSDVWSFTTGGSIAANPVPWDGHPNVSEDTTEVS
ncbi:hypothetical protein AMJ44_02895, partial [candidate division WOR-1 bacterium DG_54_3]